MTTEYRFYAYNPSHIAPTILTLITATSLLLHLYQNFKHKSWRITFFLVWGNLFFTIGWAIRSASSFHQNNSSLYKGQCRLIIAAVPIYAAAEYNILGRLLRYVPMHTPVHPDRILYIFIFLGVVVETLTGTGLSMVSAARVDHYGAYKTGNTLLAIAFLLQALVEGIVFCFIVVLHRRCSRSNSKIPKNIQRLCILLYVSSILVSLHCICRTIETFGLYNFYDTENCRGLCAALAYHEWFLYLFEATPMVVYTLWLNLMHPGTLLPSNQNVYLDVDGKTERIGPGWIDRRSRWEIYIDPFDIEGRMKGKPAHEKFWLEPQRWARVTNA